MAVLFEEPDFVEVNLVADCCSCLELYFVEVNLVADCCSCLELYLGES